MYVEVNDHWQRGSGLLIGVPVKSVEAILLQDGFDHCSHTSDEVVQKYNVLGWVFITRQTRGENTWSEDKAFFVCNTNNMTFVIAVLTHHSTDVSGKGDSFARFILGAAAAASQGVSPNDTWENKCIFTLKVVTDLPGNDDDSLIRKKCGYSSLPWSGNMSNRCRLFLRDEGKPLPLDRRRCRLDSIAAGETMPAGGTFPIFSYNSSISLFWAVCRACTSVRCLMRDNKCKWLKASFLLLRVCNRVLKCF